MPSKLKTGLTMANPNDFVLVEKNINDNLIKIDDDVDATWGGEYGGYIQDTSVTKVVGKRYIDRFDKKAYECLVPSHENTITNYQACNVKDSLSKLNNLSEVTVHSDALISIKRSDGSITYIGNCRKNGGVAVVNLPIPLVFLTNTRQVHVTATHSTDSIETQSTIHTVGSYVVDETTVKFNSTGSSAVIVFNINGFWKNPIL